jgi:hypothetical protein
MSWICNKGTVLVLAGVTANRNTSCTITAGILNKFISLVPMKVALYAQSPGLIMPLHLLVSDLELPIGSSLDT